MTTIYTSKAGLAEAAKQSRHETGRVEVIGDTNERVSTGLEFGHAGGHVTVANLRLDFADHVSPWPAEGVNGVVLNGETVRFVDAKIDNFNGAHPTVKGYATERFLVQRCRFNNCGTRRFEPTVREDGTKTHGYTNAIYCGTAGLIESIGNEFVFCCTNNRRRSRLNHFAANRVFIRDNISIGSGAFAWLAASANAWVQGNVVFGAQDCLDEETGRACGPVFICPPAGYLVCTDNIISGPVSELCAHRLPNGIWRNKIVNPDLVAAWGPGMGRGEWEARGW